MKEAREPSRCCHQCDKAPVVCITRVELRDHARDMVEAREAIRQTKEKSA
jgi:hypothetical protein